MPFDFLKRRKPDAQAPTTTAAPAAAAAPARGTAFDGFTEEWRLVGHMAVEGRLSDALNKREPIAISGVRWAPLDGSAPLADAPGLASIDPYDLILVIAGRGSLPEMSEAERGAHRIHKVRYELSLELPPFRVIGSVFMYPGSEPARLLDRASEMFLPVVSARAMLGGQPVDAHDAADMLVNRAYLRGVEQVDAGTGEKPEPLPGLVPGSAGPAREREDASGA